MSLKISILSGIESTGRWARRRDPLENEEFSSLSVVPELVERESKRTGKMLGKRRDSRNKNGAKS